MGNTWPLPNQLKKTTGNSSQPDLEELGQDRRRHQRSTHRSSLQWHTVEGHSYNQDTLSSFQFSFLADTCSQAPKKEAHRTLLDQVPCKCTTLQSHCTQNCGNGSTAVPLPSKFCQLKHGLLKTNKHWSTTTRTQIQTISTQLISYKGTTATPSEATTADQDPFSNPGPKGLTLNVIILR